MHLVRLATLYRRSPLDQRAVECAEAVEHSDLEWDPKRRLWKTKSRPNGSKVRMATTSGVTVETAPPDDK
jgi:hypothetical protein